MKCSYCKKELEMNVHLLRVFFKNKMDNEALRNNGTNAMNVHSYSETCSCGRCHCANMLAEALNKEISLQVKNG